MIQSQLGRWAVGLSLVALILILAVAFLGLGLAHKEADDFLHLMVLLTVVLSLFVASGVTSLVSLIQYKERSSILLVTGCVGVISALFLVYTVIIDVMDFLSVAAY